MSELLLLGLFFAVGIILIIVCVFFAIYWSYKKFGELVAVADQNTQNSFLQLHGNFKEMVAKTLFDPKCSRCGKGHPKNCALLGAVSVRLCISCQNEWEQFSRKTKEYEDWCVATIRLSAIKHGGLTFQPNKYDECVQLELQKEKEVYDRIRPMIAKWMNSYKSPARLA